LIAADSCGFLHLRGATNFASAVKIRDNEFAYGQLRGWGMTYQYSSSADTPRMRALLRGFNLGRARR